MDLLNVLLFSFLVECSPFPVDQGTYMNVTYTVPAAQIILNYTVTMESEPPGPTESNCKACTDIWWIGNELLIGNSCDAILIVCYIT